MPEYAKKTVVELQEILKSRSLPSSGKKAELIARLNEHDKEMEGPAQPPAVTEPMVTPTPVPEPAQPIDTAAISEPEPAVESAPMPLDSEQPIDPTPTAEPVTDNPSPDTSLANQTNYSLNLPTSTVDAELAKRKARAERFGISSAAATGTETGNDSETPVQSSTTTNTNDPPTAEAQALKPLERAKRFGTGNAAISKLDEALSSEPLQRGSRKRGHASVAAEATELDDPGLKRSFMNRGRGVAGASRSRGGERGRRRGTPTATGSSTAKPQGIQKTSAPAYTSEKDKLAAEARRKKFATA